MMFYLIEFRRKTWKRKIYLIQEWKNLIYWWMPDLKWWNEWKHYVKFVWCFPWISCEQWIHCSLNEMIFQHMQTPLSSSHACHRCLPPMPATGHPPISHLLATCHMPSSLTSFKTIFNFISKECRCSIKRYICRAEGCTSIARRCTTNFFLYLRSSCSLILSSCKHLYHISNWGYITHLLRMNIFL